MRRLARHLFTLCSAVSLLLCVAVCVLWVRSYWWADEVSFTAHREYRFFSLDGRLNAYCNSIYEGDPRGPLTLKRLFDRTQIRYGAKNPDEFWYSFPENEWFSYQYQETAGLGVFTADRGTEEAVWVERSLHRYLTFPHGCLAGLGAIVPLWTTTSILTLRHRRTRNLCAACGYDLRASPGRCPECGTVGQA